VPFDQQILPQLALSEKKHGHDRHWIGRLLDFSLQTYLNNLAKK
jgi:hypothetical protein